MHYLIMEEYPAFEDQIDFYVKGFVDSIIVAADG
jgi:hypothetical protein